MTANFRSLKKKDDEPINIENESLRMSMLLRKRAQNETKYAYNEKPQNKSIYTSSRSPKWILEVSIVSIVVALLILCYLIWKDQRTSKPDDLFKDTLVMKDVILNQIVQAH